MVTNATDGLAPWDLLNTLAAITHAKAGFPSLGNTWADITTPRRGRLLLTVLVPAITIRGVDDPGGHCKPLWGRVFQSSSRYWPPRAAAR